MYRSEIGRGVLTPVTNGGRHRQVLQYYKTVHPNPIGLLYEKCKLLGAAAPKTLCLASSIGGEHVIQVSAFSTKQSGASNTKQEAKAIAAFKILVELGYLCLPEETRLSELKENLDPEVCNSDICVENGNNDSISSTFSQITAPEFNKNNPILSVNWILQNTGKALAEVFYESVRQEDKSNAWLATCMAEGGTFLTSAVGSTKRSAEVEAVEAMHNALLADPDMQRFLKQFDASVKRKTLVPVKISRDYPANWATMRHPNFLPNGALYDVLREKSENRGDEEVPTNPALRLNILAKTIGFTFDFKEWPHTAFFILKERLMENSKNAIEIDDDVRLTLSITFDASDKSPVSLAGLGRTSEKAKENATLNALRYFDILERAFQADYDSNG